MNSTLLCLFLFFSIQLFGQIGNTESIEQMDTIMTFDPVTYEEVMTVMRRKNSQGKIVKFTQLKRPMINIQDQITSKVQIDTIITFYPETYEETIEVFHTTTTIDGDVKNIHSITPLLDPSIQEVDRDTIISYNLTNKKKTILILTRRKKNRQKN